MADQLKVDAGLMQSVGHGAANIADNMVNHARTLGAGISFARDNWQGQAGDAFRASTQDQSELLANLIEKLKVVSDTVKRGGQGFASQDATAHAKVAAQGQNFLSAPLNH